MKKILFINDIITSGGVENVMNNLINSIESDKYKITVMSAKYDPEFYNLYNDNINYVSLDPKGLILNSNSIYAKINNKIKYFINKLKLNKIYNNYDVVILMAIKTAHVTEWVSSLPITKKIAWLHGDMGVQKIEFTNSQLKCLSKFESIICVSETVKEHAMIEWGSDLNYVVRYNPLNTKRIDNRLDEKIVINRPTDVPLFITVGRLTTAKAYDRLLRVCARLNEKYKYELWIIGDGEEREDLERIISEFKLKNIKLLGFKSNPYIYMKQADLYIQSSAFEGFSVVSQEAMYLSLPIISTECSGARELLGYNNEYGMVVENSENGLFDGLEYILNNLDVLEHYKSKSIEKKSFFDFEARVNDILGLI